MRSNLLQHVLHQSHTAKKSFPICFSYDNDLSSSRNFTVNRQMKTKYDFPTSNRNCTTPFIGTRPFSYSSALSYYSVIPNDSISLMSLIPEKTINTIKALPEVEQILSALENNNIKRDNSLMELVDRSIQIFEHVGDSEHKSILFIKATCLSQYSKYSDAIQVLKKILLMKNNDGDSKDDEESFLVKLCLLKLLWYDGSFEECLRYGKELCDEADSITVSNEKSDEYSRLKQGCLLNAVALIQLLTCKKLEDIDVTNVMSKVESRERCNGISDDQKQGLLDTLTTIKSATAMLECAYKTSGDSSQIQLALASSYCNQGIVAFISDVLCYESQKSPTHNFEGATQSWKLALDILDNLQMQYGDSIHVHQMAQLKVLKAQLYCNLAWITLFGGSYVCGKTKLKEYELKHASEFASKAVKQCDEIMETTIDENNLRPAKYVMAKALGLLASCYARAGSAVSAEGLLKSSIDLFEVSSNTNNSPFLQIDARSSHFYYSFLCKNWEKRETDAKKHEDMAMDIDSQVQSLNWRSSSAIYSGLCLFTISDFK